MESQFIEAQMREKPSNIMIQLRRCVFFSSNFSFFNFVRGYIYSIVVDDVFDK